MNECAVREQVIRTGRWERLGVATAWDADLSVLRDGLLAGRREAAAAGPVIAVGVTPVEARAELRCGMLVDVTVPGNDLVVDVCRRIRMWLPVIHALTANSPVAAGADTGYASWGFVAAQREALGKLVPPMRGTTDPEVVAGRVREAAGAVGRAMLGADVRPFPGRPAIRVDAGDVCLSVDDAILVTGLIRAAVATAVHEAQAGRSGVLMHEEFRAAADWGAARDGMGGTLIDLRLGTSRPAWELAGEFFATVTPGLASDLDLVLDGLDRMRADGNGAQRQRHCFDKAGGVVAGLADLADETVAG